MSTLVYRQPALATSAFHALHDELLVYITLFCAPHDLMRLSEVNSVFYVFAREEPLWMSHCLRIHGGDFVFHTSWRITTFFPRQEPTTRVVSIRPSVLTQSDFLYRRWCRCRMDLSNYILPLQDTHMRRMPQFHVDALSHQTYYEQYAQIPFILTDATTQWPAMKLWTLPQLTQRFDSTIRHRITHNLDIVCQKTPDMTWKDYAHYLKHGAAYDETPLYIFDPEFAEKMPSLLNDYNVSDLRVFQDDIIQELGQARTNAESQKPKKQKSFQPHFRWLVIGPARSGAPWHTDPAQTSAWNALISGRKRWALYPPSCPPPGVRISRNRETNQQTAMNMTSLYWYLHVYPTLLPHQRPLEVIQEAGQVIYVPNGWWHLVLNLEDTISVTQNFVQPHNLTAFVSDLIEDQDYDILEHLQDEMQRYQVRTELIPITQWLLIPKHHGYDRVELYVASFSLISQWKSYIQRLCHRHRLSYQKIQALTTRVNPTFAVGKTHVIKFYSAMNVEWTECDVPTYLTPSFTQQLKRNKVEITRVWELKQRRTWRDVLEECFRIELTTYHMISHMTSTCQDLKPLATMIPQCYHSGHVFALYQLEDNQYWRWPYIILEYNPQLVSIHRLRGNKCTRKSWERLAIWLSQSFQPLLYHVSIPTTFQGIYGHCKATWAWYCHYLQHRRRGALAFHWKENVIPPLLLNQVETFLPSLDDIDQLLPVLSKPVLIHGDLTDENVLGKIEKPLHESLTTWLESIGCQAYVGLLVEQEALTMESIQWVQESQLETIGVPLGPRLQILAAIKAMKHSVELDDEYESESEEEDDDENTVWWQNEEDLERLRMKRLSRCLPGVEETIETDVVEWYPTQVIDFADAKTGDPLYDLVAIFFAALHCDRTLWRLYLEAPYWQQYIQNDIRIGRRQLGERFLQLVLLHPSQCVSTLFYYFPQALRATSWSHVAHLVFENLFET